MHIYILVCMCMHFCVREACARGMSLGEHTLPSLPHAWMHAESKRWAACVLVPLTVWPVSAGCRTCVCGHRNTRVLPFSLPLVSPSSTSLVMKFFSSQVEDLINGDKVRTWHTLWFFSGKASFFLFLPLFFALFFPSSS